MKSISGIIAIFLIVSSSHQVFSQKYLSGSNNETSELKYLSENQAEEYIDFEAKYNRGRVQVKWSASGEKRNNTFHILRGEINNNGIVQWDIIATINNTNNLKKKFSYIDSSGSDDAYYRLMVIDDAEEIQYTSIFKVVIGHG